MGEGRKGVKNGKMNKKWKKFERKTGEGRKRAKNRGKMNKK